MRDKVCLITGGTSGIGLHTALGLARKGARLILVGRDRERGSHALRLIEDASGGSSAGFIAADLSQAAHIQRLALEVERTCPRLDVLINNAGGLYVRRHVSSEGLEMTFALNHLGYFRLTNLLLRLLKSSGSSRIVNVSSAAHFGARMNFADLQLTENYGPMRAYGQSKLANLLFTFELARRLEGTQVAVNALHPGFVATNLGKQNLIARPFVSLLFFLFGRSPQKGARTPIYLATSEEVDGVSGKYFVDCEPVRSSPASHNRSDAARLWEISLTFG